MKQSGSGTGIFVRGEEINNIGTLNAGDLLIHDSVQFKAVNVVKILELPAGFSGFGDRKYGIFVNPNNPDQRRLSDDQFFAIWDFQLPEYRRAIANK